MTALERATNSVEKNCIGIYQGGGCPECRRITALENYKRNQEKNIQRAKEWNIKNREKYNENIKQWAKKNKNKNKKLKWNQKWYNANIEKARDMCRKKYNKWKLKNKDKLRQKKARRRAKELFAYPSWANKNKILQKYKEAVIKMQKTKIKHHVDHIYPLNSKWLCGLHVENNLQVISEKENLKKGNRTWPGQFNFQKGSVYDIFSKELTDLLND